MTRARSPVRPKHTSTSALAGVVPRPLEAGAVWGRAGCSAVIRTTLLQRLALAQTRPAPAWDALPAGSLTGASVRVIRAVRPCVNPAHIQLERDLIRSSADGSSARWTAPH